MDVKLAIVLLGLFLVTTVESDVRRIENKIDHHPRPCQQQPGQIASGGSLDEMVGNLFPCDITRVTQHHHHLKDQNEDDLIPELPQLPTAPQDVRYNQQRSNDIALSVFELSQRLMENISNETSNKFEILSPISVASALQLALLGAHGLTFNELMDVLEYNMKPFSQLPSQIHDEFGLILEDLENNAPNPSRFRPRVPWRQSANREYEKKAMRFQSNQPNYREHKISVANGIFVQRDFTIRSEYTDVVQNVYRSEIQTLDFRREPQQSAKVINDWVNEKTNGKIKEIVGSRTNPETRVILANALYFNAEWQETFIDGATGSKKFYPDGKDSDYSIMVELMAHGGKFPHYYDAESDCEILGLPYKQNATTMYVILPRNSSRVKLKEAQRVLTAGRIENMISQMVIKTAVILFPKMHMTCSHNLKSKLQDLGLKSLFEPNNSDLSLMSEGSYQKPVSYDIKPTFRPILPMNFNEQLIFSRSKPEQEEAAAAAAQNRTKREVTYKTISEGKKSPLTVKDFMLRKRIIKKGQEKKLRRYKRQFYSIPTATDKLEQLRRRQDLVNPRLFAEEVIHKVDLTVNEKGTEGGAATAITLNRSGTSVVFRVDTPFMFLIRHDPTHIPLFYGMVFEPQN